MLRRPQLFDLDVIIENDLKEFCELEKLIPKGI